MRTERQILPVASPGRKGMDSPGCAAKRLGVKEGYLILTLYL
jgi:hypothetical protein